jgi:steroid delta-isomerase-like uncharacterized protein
VPVDWELYDRLHSDDFKDCASAGRATTKAAFGDALRDFVTAFPDLVATVEDLVVDEEMNRVAVRWSASGTNTSRYLGVGPTNKKTHITGIEIIEILDGRIVKRWGEWDITDHARAK